MLRLYERLFMNHKILNISKQKSFSFKANKLYNLKTSDFKYKKSKDLIVEIINYLSFSSSLDMNFGGSIFYINDENFQMTLNIKLSGYYTYFVIKINRYGDKTLITKDKKNISFEELKLLYNEWEYNGLVCRYPQVISEVCTLESFLEDRNTYLPVIEMMLQ